jgi:hypothetical protein
MRNWVKGLGVTLLVSAVACSSSGGGGSVTSVPGSKSLATLTPADTAQICTDTSAYVTRNVSKSDLCKLAGLFAAPFVLVGNPNATDADVQTACSDAVTSCNSSSADGGSTATCSVGDTSTCNATATVDEYSKCVTDTTSALKGTLNAIPACSSLTVASLSADGGTGGTSTPPASCVTLMNDCPDISPPVPTGG